MMMEVSRNKAASRAYERSIFRNTLPQGLSFGEVSSENWRPSRFFFSTCANNEKYGGHKISSKSWLSRQLMTFLWSPQRYARAMAIPLHFQIR
jgi:hypothetical protein